ncbi:hypothetical protein HNQ41_001203 [Texcoconibacillus texcoconensis]|uniref:Uncharacterized protein n=1 Tax=Texcoconibacillus texcoconensis TaxID=1095777 RepID=A0A840QNV0_9BACI|nr:hypothetical protein [Texcoconibacillus texcoconensis]
MNMARGLRTYVPLFQPNMPFFEVGRTYVPLIFSLAGNEGDFLQLAELMSVKSSK